MSSPSSATHRDREIAQDDAEAMLLSSVPIVLARCTRRPLTRAAAARAPARACRRSRARRPSAARCDQPVDQPVQGPARGDGDEEQHAGSRAAW